MGCWEAPEFSLLLDVASPFDLLLREKKKKKNYSCDVSWFNYYLQHSYLTDILHGQ